MIAGIIDSFLGQFVWPVIVSKDGKSNMKLPPGTLWFTDDGYVVCNSKTVGNFREDYRFTIPPETIIDIYVQAGSDNLWLYLNGNHIPAGKTFKQILEASE